MRPLRPTLLLVAALGAAFLLAACGGSDDEPESRADESSPGTEAITGAEQTEAPAAETTAALSDEEQIAIAIEALLVDQDNDLVCGEVLTRSLLRSAYGDLAGCLNGRQPVTLAESVAQIDGLEVDGDAAAATATPVGGLYDGVELEIEAVRGDGDWRIDQFIADIPVGP